MCGGGFAPPLTLLSYFRGYAPKWGIAPTNQTYIPEGQRPSAHRAASREDGETGGPLTR